MNVWMNHIDLFHKKANIQVNKILDYDPKEFIEYRDIEIKGVNWIHHPKVLRMFIRNDWKHRAKIIKRDRLIYSPNGRRTNIEMYGIRIWSATNFYY